MSRKYSDNDRQTYIAQSHDVCLDTDYLNWVDEVATRYEQARARASVRVNYQKLLWNWQMGRDLVTRRAEERWGTGVVEQLSLDLQNRYPGEKGLGSRNLWNMKRWYLFYAEKLQQLDAETGAPAVSPQVAHFVPTTEKLQQTVAEIQLKEEESGLPFSEVFSFVPWGHHLAIICACKTLEESLFYLRKTIEGNWSRAMLENGLKTNLYRKQGCAVTNYAQTLPLPQANLAQEITKENYDFGFLTLPEGFAEKQLEDALCEQMIRFLLELGSGFAFVGRQKELVVDGTSRRIDLLFYHIHLHCYVVIELKAVAFVPEFAGKLNFYVTAVNHLLKTPADNPTIGLLICSDMKKTEVKWSFETIQAPIGVATYSNIQVEELKKQLPSVKQLQERVRLLELELKTKALNRK